MGSICVIVEAPCLDDFPSLAEGCEDMLVEALIAKFTVEALDERVLCRLARRDVVQANAAQRNITRLVSSVPLSITMVAGRPRISPSNCKTRTTRSPESDVSTSIVSDSCVKSSTIVSALIRRPEASVS
jgi:hypothetical protein